MKYQDSSGLTQDEISNWDYDEAQKKAEQEQQLNQEPDPQEQLPVSTADSLPSEDMQGPTYSNSDVARTEQKSELESGAVSNVGNALSYGLQGGYMDDALNAGAAALNQLSGGRLQGVDDFFKSNEELQQAQADSAKQRAEKRAAGEMSGPEAALDTTLNAITGIDEGIEAGLLLPASLAARVTNQAAPWADTPETLKNSPVGDSLMKITEVLVPTLLTGGLAGKSFLGAKAVESAVETVPQRSSDDLILGNQVATAFGDVADYLGFDGEELVRDLKRGDNFRGQALVAAVGFMQNMAINVTIDRVLGYFSSTVKAVNRPNALPGGDPKLLEGESFKGNRLNRAGQPRLPGQKGLPSAGETSAVEEVSIVVHPADPKVAKILGKSPEDVAKAVDDTVDPGYTASAEPADVIDVDTFLPTSKPSKGNKHVSEEALIREMVQGRSGVGRDGLTDVDRSYFTNWSAISDQKGMAEALNEITASYQRLRKFPTDVKEIRAKAAHFWKANRALLNDDVESFARKMYKEGGIKPLEGRLGMNDFADIDWKRAMREEMMADEEGFTILALAGEQLGVQTTKMARMLKSLEFGSMDFTNAMEVFVNYHEKADLLFIPLRRAKRKWAAEGFSQQLAIRKALESVIGSERLNTIKAYADAGATADDFTRIGFDEANPGGTLRQLWDRFKGGDEEAGKVLKAYMEHLSTVQPDMAHQAANKMAYVLDKYLKDQVKDTIGSLWYAGMLTTTEPIKAALAGSVLQNGILALGDVARAAPGSIFSLARGKGQKKEFWYAFGKLQGALTTTQANTQVFYKSLKENKLIHNTTRFRGMEPQTLAQKQMRAEWAHKNAIDRIKRQGGNPVREFNEHLWYALTTVANHPFVQVSTRALAAIDQGGISTTANMEAVARAYVKAFEDGKLQNIEAYIDGSRMSMFKDGVITGSVTDPDVLAAARNLSLQNDIPRGDDAIFFDNIFSAMEDATKTSGAFKIFNAFPRLSWNAIDRALMLDPTGVFARIHPRYRAIIAGEYGPSQQQQLKSFIAAGRLTMLGMTMPVLNGNIIGQNPPPGMEQYRNSFIFKNPDGGITSFDYSRYQPFSAMLSVFADTVNGVKDKVINTQQLDVFLSQMGVSLSMNLRGQTFLSGLDEMSRILALRNAEKNIPLFFAEQIAGMTGVFGIKQLTRAFQPYETINKDGEDDLANMFLAMRNRGLGGAGNPIKYDRYTGEALTKNGPNGVGYWEATANNLAQVFGYAGTVKTRRGVEPVQEVFDEVEYDTAKWDKLHTVKSAAGTVELSAAEQSRVDQLSADPKVGNLQARILATAASNSYQKILRDYKAHLSKGLGGAMNDKSTARQLLQRLYNMLDAAHTQARTQAVNYMVQSGEFPELVNKTEEARIQKLLQF